MQGGEVWLINLDPAVGAEIKKTRPAVIVNDDVIGILPDAAIVPSTARTVSGWKLEFQPSSPSIQ